MSELAPGVTGERTIEVTDANSTEHIPGLRVFATPFLVQLLERTCLTSVQPYLAEGETTVGTGIDIRHMAGTPQGMKVTAKSVLTEVKGRKLVFKVEAFDEMEKVAEGTHWRAVVKIADVAERMQKKAQS